MNNLPYSFLDPYDCDKLTKIRLGNEGDGGYCIPQEILKDIHLVVTFGVNDEDSFEIALSKELKNNAHFILCDPFCEYTARAGNENFIFKSLGLAGETSEEKKMTSWVDFRKNLQIQENIFLKVDIEFAEWDSFKNLHAEDLKGVDVLVIEFHFLLSKLYESGEDMKKVLATLDNQYYLYHIHANNNGYIVKTDTMGFLPDVIECTYVSKDWATKNGYTFTNRVNTYPESIDRPCYEKKFDPTIDWWTSKVPEH